MGNINVMLGRVKISLYLLFVILCVAIVYIVILLNESSQKIDDVSIEASQSLFANVFAREKEDLGTLTKDYAFWNDAVENLILRQDERFIADNFLGGNMSENNGVYQVMVVDMQQQIKVSVKNDQLDPDPNSQPLSDDLQLLAKQALATDLTDPAPLFTVTKLDGFYQLVSMVPITPNDSYDGLTLGKAYGVLIMTRLLEPTLINSWRDDFRFRHMQIVAATQRVPFVYLQYPLLDSSGKLLAKITWQPEVPGTVFLSKAIPGLTLVVFALIAVSIIFWLQINTYMTLTLKAADDLEDSHAQLNKLAYYDATTQLPNRMLGMDRLNQALKTGRRHQRQTAVIFVDLDNFKAINDDYGHMAGDKVLRAVGQRLSRCIRHEDTVARFGGDEFIIVLSEIDEPGDAEVVVRKLWQALNLAIPIGESKAIVTASIGVAVAPEDADTADALIRKADDAMYQTKHSGKNNFGFYTHLASDSLNS